MIPIHPEQFSDDVVDMIADTLKRGGVVAHPTETVYGLAANITNEHAVRRIYHLKRRDRGKALSVMVDSVEMIESVVGHLTSFELDIVNNIFPGPVTLVIEAKKKMMYPFFDDRNTVGFRMPDYSLCKKLFKFVDFPVTTTSANRSGLKNPQLAMEVMAHFGREVDLLIDGGKTQNSEPSTILDLSGQKITVLRNGAFDVSDLLEKHGFA